jgi:hypothetical protein
MSMGANNAADGKDAFQHTTTRENKGRTPIIFSQ